MTLTRSEFLAMLPGAAFALAKHAERLCLGSCGPDNTFGVIRCVSFYKSLTSFNLHMTHLDMRWCMLSFVCRSVSRRLE